MSSEHALRWSLITVTHNSEDALKQYWGAPLPPGVEWIVVDNASTDRTVETAAELGATIVVASDSNAGFSAANNIGFQRSSGRYVAFVNPDITVDFSSFIQLEQVCEDTGGLVAPQLSNDDGSIQPNGRGYPLLWNKIRNRLHDGEDRLRGTYLLTEEGDGVRPVCWVIGAAVLGKREVFSRLGGWDDHFFLYYEDKDISLRAWSAGMPVSLCGSARWVHGWARETKHFRLTPWMRELASMRKFYLRYPVFLLNQRAAAKRYPFIETNVFRCAEAENAPSVETSSSWSRHD
jgi:N-acetylglucosaminyl-diphospho-decaprenol L-rhamnosyltransferase